MTQAPFKRLLLLWISVGAILLPPFAGLPVAAAPGLPPGLVHENASPATAPAAQIGTSDGHLDTRPRGKNAADGSRAPLGVAPDGVEAAQPGPGSKNAGGAPGELSPESDAAVLAGAGGLLTCGQQGNDEWTTTSPDFGVIRHCSLQAPAQGWVIINATGSVAREDGPYEAHFRVGVDSKTGDDDADRWVNVYDDEGDGSDETVAVSVLKPVSAGSHSFYFLGRRTQGPGTLLVYDSTLSVTFVPGSASPARVCGESGNADWTTSSVDFEVMRRCSLSLPQPGWLLISANGSVGGKDGDYEAHFRVAVDSTTGDDDADRWVDFWTDSGDGSDRVYALSAFKKVAAGKHTVRSLGRRMTGSGTVRVYDPTLTVLYLPRPSAAVKVCGDAGNLAWTSSPDDGYEVLRQCQMTVPRDGWVVLSADASLGREDGPYEANFRIGINKKKGDDDFDRWVDVYDDAWDGTDKSVALTVRRPVKAGTNTFYFVVKRHAGTGLVRVYDPTLTVLVPGVAIYLPAVRKTY